MFPTLCGDADKGGMSLFEKETSLPYTLPEKIFIASEQLEELRCLPIALLCARCCRVSIARRFASASTIRYRSAHLVEVRSNHRLPPVSSMRRAKQCRYFARSLPPSYRHSRLTIVRRSCKRSRIAGIHGEAMYTAPDCAARAALRATNCQCKISLGGFKGGYSLLKESIPL